MFMKDYITAKERLNFKRKKLFKLFKKKPIKQEI